jgi:hypothetical protein
MCLESDAVRIALPLSAYYHRMMVADERRRRGPPARPLCLALALALTTSPHRQGGRHVQRLSYLLDCFSKYKHA